MVDSTKEYEFEIVPLYQIYYNEESLFGIYTFCTAEDLPECKPYNNNDFDDLSDKKMNKCGKLVGNMQELYLGTKYMTVSDLCDKQLIYPETFGLICNAMGIKRFGIRAIKNEREE